MPETFPPTTHTLDGLTDDTNTSEIIALDADPCDSNVLQRNLHLVDKIKINYVTIFVR